MGDHELTCERDARIRTVDERPHVEDSDIGDGEGELGEVEAEWPDSKSGSESHHPVGVGDSEGEPSERGSVADHPTIRLDIHRFLFAREEFSQCDRAVVDGSDEEQEGCNQPPDLMGVLIVVLVRDNLVRRSSGHLGKLKGAWSGRGEETPVDLYTTFGTKRD